MELEPLVHRLQSLDRAAVVAWLRELDAAVRIDAPPGLPELVVAAAQWAVERLLAAQAALVGPATAAAELARAVAVPCPVPTEAAACHYSVDLVMRQLPELLRRASALAPTDSRWTALRELALAWPLSSVGVPGLGAVASGPLLPSEALRRLYVDRILRLDDRERAADPALAGALAAAVGEHRAFARSVLAVHDALVRGERR
jgi:MoxR-vWA-beta-propeller ternary system domain bpX4